MVLSIRNIRSNVPPRTRASGFFTMVDINNQNSAAANQESQNVITDLALPDPVNPRSSTYVPDTPSAMYTPGLINLLLISPPANQSHWGIPPIVNDGIINQDRLFSAIGSVSMSFNLSPAVRALARTIEESLPVTLDRDPVIMSREIEKAICESVIRSSTAGDFEEDLQETYQDMIASTELLGVVYEDLQFITDILPQHEQPPHEIDWGDLVNGSDPSTRLGNNAPIDPIDPIASTDLRPVVVSPSPIPGFASTSPTILQYQETSPVIQNAVLVNNLVIATSGPILGQTGAPAASAPPGRTDMTRSPRGRPTPSRGSFP